MSDLRTLGQMRSVRKQALIACLPQVTSLDTSTGASPLALGIPQHRRCNTCTYMSPGAKQPWQSWPLATSRATRARTCRSCKFLASVGAGTPCCGALLWLCTSTVQLPHSTARPQTQGTATAGAARAQRQHCLVQGRAGTSTPARAALSADLSRHGCCARHTRALARAEQPQQTPTLPPPPAGARGTPAHRSGRRPVAPRPHTCGHTSCTAAMRGIFSRSFCVMATRTVITFAAGPVILTLTIGPSMPWHDSSPPPVPTKYGLISSSVVSTFSSVSSRPSISSSSCILAMIEVRVLLGMCWALRVAVVEQAGAPVRLRGLRGCAPEAAARCPSSSSLLTTGTTRRRL